MAEIRDIEESIENNQNETNEQIDVVGLEPAKDKFVLEEDYDDDDEEEIDMSKYTVVDADNLDEDEPIEGQKYALFSFMSPEGIMNCNIRMLKFRGAFPTIEKAQDHAEKLKKTDKYFKILVAESGKWVEFDPPDEHIEKEIAGNKKQQAIIDAQRKARMDKANELAGKYKKNIDKEDRGKKQRIEESKKEGAAEDHANKNRAKKQEKQEKQEQQKETRAVRGLSGREHINNARKDRMRKIIESRQEKKINAKRLEETRYGAGKVEDDNNQMQKKAEIINKASDDLDMKKRELEKTNENLEKIRRMISKK